MKHRLASRIGVAIAAGWLAGQASAAMVVVAEGERFTPQDDKGWAVIQQDESYASHTYGGMWSTHGGLLSAPAQSVGAVAVQTVRIPSSGVCRVWSKYQAPPYYNYLHKIEIAQKGKTVFSHVYGRRGTDRLWSFGALSDELWLSWGVDHDAAEAPRTAADLEQGEAEIRLVSVANDNPAGDRMIDFVLLTTEPEDTYTGLKPYRCGSPFVLDALAQTELYLRFLNSTPVPAQLKLTRGGHFQPNYNRVSTNMPAAAVEAGQWSPWFNIGPFCRLVHEEGIWVTVTNATEIKLQVARDREGKDTVGDLTVSNGAAIVLPVDITWNKDAKVVASREYARRLVDLCRTTWRTANQGRKPEKILFWTGMGDEPWIPELKDALGYNTQLPDPYIHDPIDGFAHGQPNEDRITALAAKLQDKEKIRLFSFGDEISVGSIKWGDPQMQTQFVAWVRSRKLTEADLGVAPDAAILTNRVSNPRLAWYAQQFSDEKAFEKFRRATAAVKREIGPQVETGANYSPHGQPQYYGAVYEWVDLFKANGMTMFWSEDYIFSVPQVPQTISWTFATIHCALKYNRQRCHFYVMPHAPGQIPPFLRRNMLFSVGAGANDIDNFWVAPSESWTENYVAWRYPETFRAIHEAIYDSAEAEPYQVGASRRPAKVAIVLSKATDFNERRTPVRKDADPFMAMCKNVAPDAPGLQQTLCRADQQYLYLALRHAQHAVDLITEDDIVDGRARSYEVIYFAGRWIDHRVPSRLEAWVKDGGILYVAAGIGMQNEFNEAEPGLLRVLGLSGATFTQNAEIVRPYLELPLLDPIGSIQLGEHQIDAMVVRQDLVPAGAKVIGTWPDGKPAVTVRELGKGKAFAIGTCPGHTYLKTGVRVTPWARGGCKTVYNPAGFSAGSAALAQLGVHAREIERPVVCSNPYVEALILDGARGTLLTLVNWDNTPIKGLTVSVDLPFKPAAVRSVQQQKTVEGWTYEKRRITLTTDLEWADYVTIARR